MRRKRKKKRGNKRSKAGLQAIAPVPAGNDNGTISV